MWVRRVPSQTLFLHHGVDLQPHSAGSAHILIESTLQKISVLFFGENISLLNYIKIADYYLDLFCLTEPHV